MRSRPRARANLAGCNSGQKVIGYYYQLKRETLAALAVLYPGERARHWSSGYEVIEH